MFDLVDSSFRLQALRLIAAFEMCFPTHNPKQEAHSFLSKTNNHIRNKLKTHREQHFLAIFVVFFFGGGGGGGGYMII